MSVYLFLSIWAACGLGAVFVIAGAFVAAGNRERHFQRLRQAADEAAEREARNRTLPREGKTARIWR